MRPIRWVQKAHGRAVKRGSLSGAASFRYKDDRWYVG